jgi:hypothetical protein
MRAGKFPGRNGAKNLLARKCDFAVKDGPVADARGDGSLNEPGHASGHFRFDVKCLAGENGVLNFYGANGGEFQIAQRFASGIALGDDAGQLGARFEDENAGHEGRAGKMAAKKRFGWAQCVFAAPLFAGIEFDDAIKEAKFRTMRQERERFFVGRHFFIGSTMV